MINPSLLLLTYALIICSTGPKRIAAHAAGKLPHLVCLLLRAFPRASGDWDSGLNVRCTLVLCSTPSHSFSSSVPPLFRSAAWQCNRCHYSKVDIRSIYFIFPPLIVLLFEGFVEHLSAAKISFPHSAEKHFQENQVPPSLDCFAKKAATIKVYFHVIRVSEDETLAGGNVPYVRFPRRRQTCG